LNKAPVDLMHELGLDQRLAPRDGMIDRGDRHRSAVEN